ncbi:S49 family peptidase domain-containing protein [Acidiferrobacter thiooxydans]|uniref:hypothetical protein n=1 Tax=Acidiferrobacter thiooxydans TaxID=163359 RepID=UPI001B86C648|nr:hypothetical protein [Acidiferrobacter thiooxydans]
MSLLFWRAPRIPVLSLRGIIAAKPYAISLAAYREPIERAVALAKPRKRLILSIESPGGHRSSRTLSQASSGSARRSRTSRCSP